MVTPKTPQVIDMVTPNFPQLMVLFIVRNRTSLFLHSSFPELSARLTSIHQFWLQHSLPTLDVLRKSCWELRKRFEKVDGRDCSISSLTSMWHMLVLILGLLLFMRLLASVN